MAKRDYYEILNIPKDAAEKTIKQAYRKLALKLHPDRNPDNKEAEEQFKEAAEAYDVLSNPEKRSIYDRYGHEGLQGQQSGFSGMEDIFSHFGDIFSDFFGGDIFGANRRSTRPPRPPRGSDLRVNLTITFEEAFLGAKKKIEINQRRTCKKCNGTGSAPGSEVKTCHVCNGHGQVIQRTGFMTLASPCPNCGGSGTVITSPCPKCDGTGMEPFSRSVTASVPAGVDSGMRLSLAGEGEKPKVGDPGDLYVFIRVQDHKYLIRDENDIYYKLTLPYTKAALGHTVKIKLVDETIDVKIPAGTQPDEIITVKEKGFPYVGHDERGDLKIVVKVTIPDKISSKEKKLLQNLDTFYSDEG
jgi:molecular chaperone DnaJ